MTERDVLELAEKIAARVALELVGNVRGIVPERVYPPEEAAELIGITSERRAKTIRTIPADVLPYIEVIPGGRTIGYRGRDLIRYLDEQTRGAA